MSTVVSLTERPGFIDYNVPPYERPVWAEMIAKPDKYVPLITRLVAYCLFCNQGGTDERGEEIEVNISTLRDDVKPQFPELAKLTEDEFEFVLYGAFDVLRENPHWALEYMAEGWIKDGAPV